MNSGIFAVWKPKGPTSNDIVQQIKRITRISKVGHAGTLDPLAEGVLVVGVGREATRQLSEVVAKEKEYRADMVRYEERLKDYERSVENCPNRFQEHVDYLEKDSLDALNKCQRRSYCNPENDSDFATKRKKFLFVRRDGYRVYCDGRYTKPTMPTAPR